MEKTMSENKKLVLLELDEETYKNLKHSALQSSRMLGNEVAVRLEYAINHFEGFSQELIEKQNISAAKDNIIVQIQLQQKVHTKLKTMASSSNIFMKEFSALLLMQNVQAFEFVANSENAIPKLMATHTKPAN